MKPVFKCDYCSHMGTKEEVREHEETCMDNYDKRSCYTCQHRGKLSMVNNLIKYECSECIEIPEGKIYEYCPSYKRKEKSNYDLGDIFGSFLGGR